MFNFNNKLVIITICALIVLAFFTQIFYFFNKQNIGQKVFVESLNPVGNSGKYCAKYNDKITFYDNKDRCIKIKNVTNGDIVSIFNIDTISHITVNENFIYFLSENIIYQITYSGNLNGKNDNFSHIDKVILYDENLYVYASYYENAQYNYGVYNLSANNIEQKPIYYKNINDVNKYLDIEEQYQIIQVSHERKLKENNGFEIKLPEKYNYRYLLVNDNKLILLGQQWKTIGRQNVDLPARYHISDIIIEVDKNNNTVNEIFKSISGERIIGYVNGDVFTLKGRKIFKNNLDDGEKINIGSLNYFDSLGNLNVSILGTELFIYKFNERNSKLVFFRGL
jgi:hypothetical protein